MSARDMEAQNGRVCWPDMKCRVRSDRVAETPRWHRKMHRREFVTDVICVFPEIGWPKVQLIGDPQGLETSIQPLVFQILHQRRAFCSCPRIVSSMQLLFDRRPEHVLLGILRSEMIAALGPANHALRLACNICCILHDLQ